MTKLGVNRLPRGSCCCRRSLFAAYPHRPFGFFSRWHLRRRTPGPPVLAEEFDTGGFQMRIKKICV
jgi:hypothetical protein